MDSTSRVVYLTRKAEFAASHYYHNPSFTPEENQRVFGKCNNPNGHGHTYGLEVTVEGEIDPETGYVMDFALLKRAVDETVIRRLDRRHLNFDVDFLKGINPTAENIAVGIWKQLAPRVAPARLVRVSLQETEKNSVVYEGGQA